MSQVIRGGASRGLTRRWCLVPFPLQEGRKPDHQVAVGAVLRPQACVATRAASRAMIGTATRLKCPQRHSRIAPGLRRLEQRRGSARHACWLPWCSCSLFFRCTDVLRFPLLVTCTLGGGLGEYSSRSFANRRQVSLASFGKLLDLVSLLLIYPRRLYCII